METRKTLFRFLLLAWMASLTLTISGCLLMAVPYVINATKGSSTSTPTVLIEREAATVYADAVKAIKQRGYTQITKQDDAKFFLEGTRKGKNATLQVAAVESVQSRVIITIENDKEAKDINEAVDALMQTCRHFAGSAPGTKELNNAQIKYRPGTWMRGRTRKAQARLQ